MKSLLSAFLIAVMIGGFGLASTLQLDKVQASTDISGIPKPSVPEFTVKYVDNSYDVPPRYDVDPYTGKNVAMEPGYHVQEKTIEVVIKNQPLTSYENANGNIISLYYSIRMKGSFGDSWLYPDYSDYMQVDYEGERVNYAGADADSDYTVIAYGLTGNNGTRTLLNLDISDGGQADFQVQAFIGYKTRVNDTYVPGIPVGDPTDPIPHHYVFIGETSGWSNTQTLTISESQTPTPSPANSPTPSPKSPQSEIVTIVAVIIVAAVFSAALGLLVYLIKRK